MIDFLSKIIETKEKRIKNYPCKVNRASQCGHPCERYLVLSRTRWQEKTLHDVNLQFIFEGGNLIEDMALQEIRDAGITVIEQQRAFEWKDIELTGHLDAKIILNGKAIPLEVKGYSHYQFEKLNSIADFFNSKKHYIQMAPAQLYMYMMNTESETGIFYLKDKLTYRPKTISVELDYDYCEKIVQKLERVNKHVAENTLPDPIDNYDICQDCGFNHICLPDLKAEAIEITDDPEFEEKLTRREELSLVIKEYRELDREIKKNIEGKERLMIGDFLITGKYIERKGYEVKPSKYWKSKILNLGK